MVDTTIYTGNIVLYEPVTAITDYIITALCFTYYFKLKGSATIQNWKLFFLFFGLSTLFGGSAHGFFGIKEGQLYKFIWLTGHALSIFSTFYAQQATLVSILKSSGRKKFWNTIYNSQLLIFIAAVVIFQNFLVVIVNTALGLIPVMILHFRDNKSKGHQLIAYGILIAFLTGAVNALKISIHDFFNHKDFAHILIMASLSLMYVGIKRISLEEQN